MKFELAVLSALAAFAVASPGAQVTIPATDLPIIAKVLPSSAQAYIAKSGEAAFSKHVASEFSAGHTPGWFTKLPTDVQTLLVPALATASGKSAASTASVASSKSTASAASSASSASSASTSAAASSSSASASSSSASASAASSSSKNAAAMPTAVYGAGLGAAVGIVGLLAL